MEGQLDGSEHRAVFHAGWKSAGRFLFVVIWSRAAAPVGTTTATRIH